MEVKRRLAAIFAADVEGYSRLTGPQEAAITGDIRRQYCCQSPLDAPFHHEDPRPAWSLSKL